MASFVFVEPIREELEHIATMIEKRRLRTFISASMPLAQAAKAHELSEGRHVQGKLVLLTYR